MLCIHTDNSNKLGIIVDDFRASTSHACDSKINSLVMKSKSKDLGTQAQGKFVPTCHNYGKVGHIKPNYFLLKTHRLGLSKMLREKVKLKNLPIKIFPSA